MSKVRHFDVAGINIRVHPIHEPFRYLALWKALWAQKTNVTHASHALMIGEYNVDTPGFIKGNFYRFLQVDTDAPWFDVDKHMKAADEDVGQVHIPPALKPNLTEIPYVLDLKRHCLYFVSHEQEMNLSPVIVDKLLKRLTGLPVIRKQFGDVDLTVLTDRGRVQEMLKMPVIRKLTITLERPNPAEEEDDETVYERLERRKLKSETHIYQKLKGEATINVDAEMHAQAENAMDNGLVEVVGKNLAGQPVKEASKDFPTKIKGTYTPTGMASQTLKDALLALVIDIGARK
ncbi:MAG: DUF4747 family protein [Pseudomonadota bacterium]